MDGLSPNALGYRSTQEEALIDEFDNNRYFRIRSWQ
jgi:hypothetical protein